MNTKIYPQEKRKVIAKFTFEQLIAFSKEIAPSLLLSLKRKLPFMQGFREGGKIEK